MMYYGSRISDNLSRSPEGFLICHNVPIARTGYQDYMGKELPEGVQEEHEIDPNKIYKVYRSPDEVFDKATIASFEGKPFTDDHPPELVTPENISMYGKGHIQNVRKGTGEYQNMLLADVMCTDANTAESILNNLKREVSCGYNYVMKKGSKGFEQTQIRGNHLALVENGRAGQKAAIQDSLPDAIQTKRKGEKKMAKSFLGKMFSAWAKDAEPGEIEEALKEMGKDAEPTGEIEAVKKDVADIKEAIAGLTETVKQLVESDKEVHKEVTDEDKLDKLEKETGDALENPEDEDAEEKENEAVGELIEAQEEEDEDIEEEEKPKVMDSASLTNLVKSMKPKLLAIKDPKARAMAVDAFVAAVNDAKAKAPRSKNTYAALNKAVKSNARSLDSKAKAKTMDDVLVDQVNAINKHNPHAKGEK